MDLVHVVMQVLEIEITCNGVIDPPPCYLNKKLNWNEGLFHWYQGNYKFMKVKYCLLQTTVEVLFIDYGNTASCSQNSTRFLTEELAQYPMQNIYCYLNGVAPLLQVWRFENSCFYLTCTRYLLPFMLYTFQICQYIHVSLWFMESFLWKKSRNDVSEGALYAWYIIVEWGHLVKEI